jgi:NRPS condensation-like uncharacterized protein
MGASEEVLWRMNQAGSVNFVMVARMRGKYEPMRLEAALRAVRLRHPMLRMRVVERAGAGEFVLDERGKIPVRVASDTTWQSAAIEEMNTAVPWGTGPLARVTVLVEDGGFRVLSTFHHAIGDATSGVWFLRDLARAYASCGDDAEDSLDPLPMLSSVDDLLPKRAAGLGLAVRAGAYLVRKAAARARPSARPKEDDAAAPVATQLISRLLSAQQVTKLGERARARSTTVHGALCAAMLRAVAREGDFGGPRSMGCLSPICLRGRVTEDVGEAVGLFVSGITTHHRVDPNASFWELASDVTDSLARARGRDDDLTGTAIQRFMRSSRDPGRLVAQVNEFVNASVTVTNIGQVDADVGAIDGAGAIEELGFCAAGNGFPGTAAGLMVTTFRGRAMLNFVYGHPQYRHERGISMFEGVVGELESASL